MAKQNIVLLLGEESIEMALLVSKEWPWIVTHLHKIRFVLEKVLMLPFYLLST